MNYEDYSKEEIETILEELLTIYSSNLKTEEIRFLNHYYDKSIGYNKKLPDHVRDNVIAMYDRIRDNSND